VYFIAPYLSKLFALAGIKINREQWLWLTLPVALTTHLLFGINTAFTEMILDPYGGWIAKVVVVFMLLMVYIRREKREKNTA